MKNKTTFITILSVVKLIVLCLLVRHASHSTNKKITTYFHDMKRHDGQRNIARCITEIKHEMCYVLEKRDY